MTPMSTQRPTPNSFARRVTTLVAMLGLGALLWSCESEQAGFEVTLPLLGPTEFDEMSCEISGDICSTNDDCFDEEGLPVGPCTPTLKRLEPITVQVSLSPSSPSFTLPAPDTASWIAPLNVRTYSDELPISIQMDDFSLEGAPVDISVRVFSRIGRITGRDLDYVPVTPDSCAFTLSDGATGDDFAGGIQTCLSDWIGENGAPLEFDMEVTSAPGAKAKSGFGLKQEQYELSGTLPLMTVRQCDVRDPVDALEAISEGSDFFGLLECNDLSFSGGGEITTEPSRSLSGGAIVYDRCGTFLAQGNLLQGVLPGDSKYSIEISAEGVDSGDLKVAFTPDPDPQVFVQALVFAGSGDCADPDASPVQDEGYAIAWWENCRVTEPPPEEEKSEGNIFWGASGLCKRAGDSGGTGATGGPGQ